MAELSLKRAQPRWPPWRTISRANVAKTESPLCEFEGASFVLPTASVRSLEAIDRATSRRHSPPARVHAAVTHCRLLILPLSLFSVPRTSVKPDLPISGAHAEPIPVSHRTHAHAHIHTLSPGLTRHQTLSPPLAPSHSLWECGCASDDRGGRTTGRRVDGNS